MALLGVLTFILVLHCAQPFAGYALNAKPLELSLLDNEYCEYGLSRRAPHKWCICWGRIGTRIEVMPWDCSSRAPKSSSRRKRDKNGWNVDEFLRSINAKKNVSPKSQIKGRHGDIHGVEFSEHDDRKKGQKEAMLAKAFTALLKNDSQRNFSYMKSGEPKEDKKLKDGIANALSALLEEDPQDSKYFPGMKSREQKENKNLKDAMQAKALKLIFKEMAESGNDLILTPSVLAYWSYLSLLGGRFVGLPFSSDVNPGFLILPALSVLQNQLKSADTADELLATLALDIAYVTSRFMVFKNAIVSDFEKLFQAIENFRNNRSGTGKLHGVQDGDRMPLADQLPEAVQAYPKVSKFLSGSPNSDKPRVPSGSLAARLLKTVSEYAKASKFTPEPAYLKLPSGQPQSELNMILNLGRSKNYSKMVEAIIEAIANATGLGGPSNTSNRADSPRFSPFPIQVPRNLSRPDSNDTENEKCANSSVPKIIGLVEVDGGLTNISKTELARNTSITVKLATMPPSIDSRSIDRTDVFNSSTSNILESPLHGNSSEVLENDLPSGEKDTPSSESANYGNASWLYHVGNESSPQVSEKI